MIQQVNIVLPAYKRGFHLVSSLVLKQLPSLPQIGMLNLFIKHTSAAFAINENADPSVRTDFNSFVNRLVPDGDRIFTHRLEGDDDMAAHIKSSVFGQSLNIPITNRKLNLGTWQGIYLCEFRDYGGEREVIATIWE